MWLVIVRKLVHMAATTTTIKVVAIIVAGGVKLATRVVAMVICLAIVLMAKSVIIAVRLGISRVTAHQEQLPNELVTSASNLVTYKLNVRTSHCS